MNTAIKLREILLPILGFDSIDEVQESQSLVEDLDADSIDFVEIIYEIEQKFGVILKTSEIITGGAKSEDLFVDGRLTEQGEKMIQEQLETDRYKTGMTKVELFSAITVSDLAKIIDIKKEAGDA